MSPDSQMQEMIAAIARIAGDRRFNVKLEFSTTWDRAGAWSWWVFVHGLGHASGKDGEQVLANMRAQAAAQSAIDVHADGDASGLARRPS
jgi:hypothetical protein